MKNSTQYPNWEQLESELRRDGFLQFPRRSATIEEIELETAIPRAVVPGEFYDVLRPRDESDDSLPDFSQLALTPDEKASFSATRGLLWLAFCAALFVSGLLVGYAATMRHVANLIEVRGVEHGTGGVVTLAIGGEVHAYGFEEGSAE